MSVTKLTHTGVHKYAIPGKRAQDALSDDEKELYELCQLASVEMSPAIFRILLDLLKHNVSPVAIVQMLKTMIRNNATSNTLLSDSTSRSTLSSRGTPNSTSTSSRKGVSSVPSSARSTSSTMDSSKKALRTGSGAARTGTSSMGSGRQKSGRETTGQRQPKS